MPQMFLTREEVAVLTGRKAKATQVRQLRKMVLPFWIDADGWPIVARVTIEGSRRGLSRLKRNGCPLECDAKMVDLLSDEDVAFLTGRKQRALQIAQLTAMKIPFAVNVCGWPWVPRSAIEGTKKQARADLEYLADKMARFHAEYPSKRREPESGPA